MHTCSTKSHKPKPNPRTLRHLRVIKHVESNRRTRKPKTPKPNKTNELTTTLSNLTNLCTTWIRDLTEEGIEPNPGPRYVTKNVNGLQYVCIETLN